MVRQSPGRSPNICLTTLMLLLAAWIQSRNRSRRWRSVRESKKVLKNCCRLFKFSVFQASFQDFDFEIFRKNFKASKFLPLFYITVGLAFQGLFHIQVVNKISLCLLFYLTRLALYLLLGYLVTTVLKDSDSARYIF